MKNETTYTSDLTGLTYTVESVPQQRAEYTEFGNPASRTVVEYTEYRVLLDGKPVQFTFDKNNISAAIAAVEVPQSDISSRFD